MIRLIKGWLNSSWAWSNHLTLTNKQKGFSPYIKDPLFFLYIYNFKPSLDLIACNYFFDCGIVTNHRKLLDQSGNKKFSIILEHHILSMQSLLNGNWIAAFNTMHVHMLMIDHQAISDELHDCIHVFHFCHNLYSFFFLLSDLADLIEMIHVIVRLMENLQARGTLRVSCCIFTVQF